MTLAPSTAIFKPNLADSRTVRLTGRFLHIGSAVRQLNPYEYVQSGKFVYLTDTDLLARELQRRGFLNEYIRCVEARDPIASLLEDALGKEWAAARAPDGEAIFPKNRRILKQTSQKITDLRPAIRDGFWRHYVPGSSIKGAIRTAIAYRLLKYAEYYRVPQQQRPSAIEQRLRESMGELKHRAKKTDDDLFMDELFTNYGLSYGDREVKARQGPNTDIMRAVSVSDSEPLLEEKVERQGRKPGFINLPVVSEVLVSSHYQNSRAKYRASIYAELIFNLRTQFTLAVDTEMLAWFHHNRDMQLPFESVEDLLQICAEFGQDQWELERDYWSELKNNYDDRDRSLDFGYIREFYEKDCPYSFRLGWGSGLMGTTINLGMPEDLVEQIRDTCGIAAPGFQAPKSRRTIISPQGEIRFVPAWVKLEAL
ncbi:type III-A CRISPR-associated RAMP protein Csm5 [Synechococcus sp. PCC 7336]|uniref:type III-A CRISPR-associated RAMP protein Csm5 n=1 Tax=Synechococcus sp. PCC 7336 TaxID=195250 RepID=UPI0003466812|nr:type III-A CRISPR-associated RAMP protein Csm5 [Synechococcus sp. PCC 7336]